MKEERKTPEKLRAMDISWVARKTNCYFRAKIYLG